MSDLGIVIVNWNTRDYLRRCLQTVFASEGGLLMRVVVVDNGSTDGSVEMVRNEFPEAILITGHGNVGYPAGNNLGLCALGHEGIGPAPTAPRYTLLLNPDTELPPNALFDVVRYMDEHKNIGIIGARLELPDGTLDKACRRSMPTPEVSLWRMIGFSKLFPKNKRFAAYNLTYLDEYQTYEVGSLVGAFMMLRREAIEQTGLMDERFFMYGEDLDWCKRVAEAGWKIVYRGEITVKHVKRAASRQSRRASFEFVRAFLLFYDKHYRAQTPLLTHLAVLGGIALWGGPRLWPEIFTSRRAA